nr:basic proline-rich protein-like [Aegilops tauschii subsp. strangulata]
MLALCLSGPTPSLSPLSQTQPRPCPQLNRARARNATVEHRRRPDAAATPPRRSTTTARPAPPRRRPPHCRRPTPPQHHPTAPEPCGLVATTARRPLRPASANPPPRSPAAPSPPPPGAPSARPAPLRHRATPPPGAPGPAAGVDRMVGKGPERYWEGWFHYSSPAPPESAARQYADNCGGRFFFGWERSGKDKEAC